MSVHNTGLHQQASGTPQVTFAHQETAGLMFDLINGVENHTLPSGQSKPRIAPEVIKKAGGFVDGLMKQSLGLKREVTTLKNRNSQLGQYCTELRVANREFNTALKGEASMSAISLSVLGTAAQTSMNLLRQDVARLQKQVEDQEAASTVLFEDFTSRQATSKTTASDLQNQLEAQNRNVRKLETTLTSSQATILDLQQQLKAQQELVRKMEADRASKQATHQATIYDLRQELEAQQELVRKMETDRTSEQATHQTTMDRLTKTTEEVTKLTDYKKKIDTFISQNARQPVHPQTTPQSPIPISVPTYMMPPSGMAPVTCTTSTTYVAPAAPMFPYYPQQYPYQYPQQQQYAAYPFYSYSPAATYSPAPFTPATTPMSTPEIIDLSSDIVDLSSDSDLMTSSPSKRKQGQANGSPAAKRTAAPFKSFDTPPSSS